MNRSRLQLLLWVGLLCGSLFAGCAPKSNDDVGPANVPQTVPKIRFSIQQQTYATTIDSNAFVFQDERVNGGQVLGFRGWVVNSGTKHGIEVLLRAPSVIGAGSELG